MPETKPSRRELRVFAVGQAVCVAVGAWIILGRPAQPPVWWGLLSAVTCVVAVIGCFRPEAVAAYRTCWMTAFRPIQRLVSIVLLAAVYYFVLTPLGVLLRFFRRTPARGWRAHEDRRLVDHLWKMW